VRYVRLGKSDLKVSSIAFGIWAFAGDWSGFGRLETLQPPYHLFRREIEDQIPPYAASHDLGVLVYGPLAHGLLGGRMTAATRFPADDWRGHSPAFTGERFRRNLEVSSGPRPGWSRRPAGSTPRPSSEPPSTTTQGA
jgi:aryl-alcohol dehydrogenase-like predicted oxidoreductase